MRRDDFSSSEISVTPSLTSSPYLVVSYSIPKSCLIGLSFQVFNTELQNRVKIQVKFGRQSDLGCLIVYILPNRLFLVVQLYFRHHKSFLVPTGVKGGALH